MSKFQTHHANPAPQVYEKTNPKSETIPDQAMTLQEIMSRYVQGKPLSGALTPIYEGDEHNFPVNWNKLDLSERMDIIRNNQEKIRELTEKLQKAQAEKSLLDQRKAWEAEYERKKAAQQPAPENPKTE